MVLPVRAMTELQTRTAGQLSPRWSTPRARGLWLCANNRLGASCLATQRPESFKILQPYGHFDYFLTASVASRRTQKAQSALWGRVLHPRTWDGTWASST